MILDSDPEDLEFLFWTKKNIWRRKIRFVKEKNTEKETKESIFRRKVFFVEEEMNEEIKAGKYLVKENVFYMKKNKEGKEGKYLIKENIFC